MAEENTSDLTTLTADVVSAYVSNNKITPEEVGKLIDATYQALKGAGAPGPSEPEFAKADKAAIRKSTHPDHLTSFIDGRKYKSLKRHLTSHGLDPNQYRERYGLPHDYPMVASGYSAQRSELAKTRGLGRRSTAAPAEPAPKTPRGRKSSASKATTES